MRIIHRVTLTLLLTNLLMACTSDNNAVAQQPKVASENVETYVGKPSAPISMNYVISKQNLEPGDEFSIQLDFHSPTESPISIKTTSTEKLTLLNAQTKWQTSATAPGRREVLPALNFVAPENGTFYIKLLASVEQEDGKILSKPFVIPVVVGDGAIQLQPVGEVVIDDNGRKIIIQKGDSSN